MATNTKCHNTDTLVLNSFNYMLEEYEKDTSLVVKLENAIAETADKGKKKATNIAVRLKVWFSDILECFVGYQAVTRVLELIWVAIGIKIFNYSNLVTHFLSYINEEPHFQELLQNVCSANSTQPEYFFSFDKVLKRFGSGILKYDTFPEDEVIKISKQLQEQNNYWNMQRVRVYWDNNRYNKKKVYPD
ncbi:8164_t:CDS:2, partial [Racocetra fulgida]